MKIPKAKKLPSGNWRIQLRLGGQSISITQPTQRAAIRAAEMAKAEYRLDGKIAQMQKAPEKPPTLRELCEKYIDERRATRSPNTIRTYVNYINHRLNDIIELPYDQIEWQAAIDKEAQKIAGKTLHSAWGFFASVLEDAGYQAPKVKLPPINSKPRGCLYDDEILRFIDAMRGKKYEAVALLALHSLRASEIWALQWDNVNLKRGEVYILAAMVTDEYGEHIRRECGKSQAARRTVPILIDRLADVLRERKQNGQLVVPKGQNEARLEINAVCASLGFPPVGLHGLRHSFVSLAASLNLPERATMIMGGWDDVGTMRKIYTHVNAAQVLRSQNAMREFFKNAHENAHEAEIP